MIYKLKHPDPSKEGFVAGVDFIGGEGTTNSLEDANRLRQKFGCTLTTLEGNEVQIVEDRPKMRLQNMKQDIETGVVVLRAVVVEKETKTEGAGQSAPPVISTEPEKAADTSLVVTPLKGRPGRKKK